MNTNETPADLPSDSPDIGDQNVERLLGEAYQPESPDAAFARRVEELMCSTARERVAARAGASARVAAVRRRAMPWRRLTWSAVAATILVGVGFAVGRNLGRPADGPGAAGTERALIEDGRTGDSSDTFDAIGRRATRARAASKDRSASALVGERGLTPRRRPPAAETQLVSVGDSITTGPGERRRVTLPDGSIVFLNQNTHASLDADRQLSLESGEVYVEVSPRKPADEDNTTAVRFVVKSAGREITALGTKFGVRAGPNDAGVLVTQGTVRVSDFDQPITAGQQFALQDGPQFKGASPISPLPRASHVLDWTRELVAAAESPLVPASAHAGGSLVAVDPNGQEARLSLRKFHIDVHIEDGFARTTIDQTYFNHTSWRLEGTFHFPLPPDASLSRLAMYVEGKLMEGGMAERDHARQVFESIVARQKDPALLEWVDGSTFKMRVFPLEARQEKRIVLSYSQRLETLYGVAKYRFPAGHTFDRVRDWSFHGRVRRGAELAWSCDSHELKATRDGGDLVLDAAANEVKLGRDVAIKLTDRSVELDTRHRARFSATTHDGSRYLMLRLRPDLPNRTQRQRRDWIFLFESSGDRDPVLARVQVDVVATLLKNAEHDDTFVILTAGTQPRVLAARQTQDSSEPLAATPENVKAAIERLEAVHLVGALDLAGALAATEPFVKSAKNPTIVHVGSGITVLGERRVDELVKRVPAGARYVGVGVGKRWSRQFMKSAASRTGGYFTQINPDEPVAWRAFDLYSTLNTPRLLNASVVDLAERLTFLNDNDSIAHGEELCAIARLGAADPLPERVIVSGSLDGQPFRREIAVADVADKADYLPRTWAKLRIDQLLADNAAKRKDEIIALSKSMYVMSPFTSLLVLENEQMYVQFNVDRGRKDHWAMYPCPNQIPVVYESIPIRPQDKTAASTADSASKKPDASELLSTIVVRLPSMSVDSTKSTSHYGLGQTYLRLLVSPDDRVEFERLIGLVQGTIAPNTWSAVDSRELPGVYSLNLGVVAHSSRLANDDSLPLLATIMSEVSANNIELREMYERRKHRTLLTLLQVDKSHIPFPDEPPLEYPDATWWDEMTAQRMRWSRVDRWSRIDLTVPTRAEQRIREKLGDPVTLEFAETPLGDVVDFLRDYTQVNFVLDKLGIEEQGVTSDTPVTIHVEQITTKSALRLLLGQHNLAYQIKDDTLVITSPRQARSEMFGRVYPVADLIVPDWPVLQATEDGFGSDGPILRELRIYPRERLDTTKLKRSEAKLRRTQLFLKDYQSQNAPELERLRRSSATDFDAYFRGERGGPDRGLSFFFKSDGVEDFGRFDPPFGGGFARPWGVDQSWGISRIQPNAVTSHGKRFVASRFQNFWLDGNLITDLPGPMNPRFVRVFSGDSTFSARFRSDATVFSDLLAFAPGLSTTWQDVLAVLEKEKEDEAGRSIGQVEPVARSLIEKARGAAWQLLTIPDRDGRESVKLAFDGSGRYSFERTTADGLGERVVCDGATLWHFYPELGVGAKRSVSRFHRAELESLVPWLLPPAEEFARWADVRFVEDKIVSLSPRGAESAKDATGKPVNYLGLRLVFGDDGQLVERRLIAMPAGRVLARETYAGDGTVKLLDGDGNLVVEYKLAVEPTSPPDLAPDTKQLVVLPMPVRTVQHVLQTSTPPRDGAAEPGYKHLSDDEALRLLTASLNQNGAAVDIVGQRFFANGDRRLGFYTRLMASTLQWNPAEDFKSNTGTSGRFDPVADHSNSALARYIFLHEQQMTKSGKIEEMDLAANGQAGDFIGQLAGLRDICARWTSEKLKEANDVQRQAWREKALAFVCATRSSSFRWPVLGMLKDLGGDADFQRSLAAELRRIADVPGLTYAARYEEARSLLSAGDKQQSRERFAELHAAAIKSGFVPPIDQSFRQAFEDQPAANTATSAPWQSLMKSAAARLAADDYRPAIAALAWQSHESGDATLADELILAALGGVTDDDRLSTTLAAVEFFWQTDQFARANAFYQPLLADKEFSHDPGAWRLGAELARRHGVTDRSLECLDHALDLEYERLPDVVNLEAVRGAFGELLNRYQQQADSLRTGDSRPRVEFIARLIRATDRWRSLDSDDTAACQAAARVLGTVGADDLAWEYLTTPLAARSSESPPWLSLAATLREQKSFNLAARAFARAFEAEPANAQILWDHAQLLDGAGNADGARRLLRQIADGQWDHKYDAIHSEARQKLVRP